MQNRYASATFPTQVERVANECVAVHRAHAHGVGSLSRAVALDERRTEIRVLLEPSSQRAQIGDLALEPIT